MGKTIAVSDEVYELLKRAKKPGESFSAVIKRCLKRSINLSEIIGSRTLSIRDWSRVRRELDRSDQATQRGDLAVSQN